MARTHPDGWRQLPTNGAAGRELDTLARLAEELPDDYIVFHGLHWTRVTHGHAVFGEIDFAILGPSGRLLLIEQKSGLLSEGPEGLEKRYGKEAKSVAFQMGRSHDALRDRLRKDLRGEPFHSDALLYCPDYTVRNPGSAGIPPERIVDATRRAYLGDIIRALLPPDEPALPTRSRIERFLADELQIVPDTTASVGQARTLYTRLSGGLAQWARSLSFTPFRLRVIGTAGSGKTQLALVIFADALSAGRRPL